MSCTTDDNRDVMFELAEGQTRAIITGATNIYKLPLESNRPAFGQRICLTPEQLFLSYENEFDVVRELSITVEADGLNISPVGSAAKRSSESAPHAPAGRNILFSAWRGDKRLRFSAYDEAPYVLCRSRLDPHLTMVGRMFSKWP